MPGRQAAREREELAVAVVDRAGWKTWSRESMGQEAIRSLRATADFAGLRPWRSARRR